MYLRNGAIPKQPGKQSVDIRWILNKKIEELYKRKRQKRDKYTLERDGKRKCWRKRKIKLKRIKKERTFKRSSQSTGTKNLSRIITLSVTSRSTSVRIALHWTTECILIQQRPQLPGERCNKISDETTGGLNHGFFIQFFPILSRIGIKYSNNILTNSIKIF